MFRAGETSENSDVRLSTQPTDRARYNSTVTFAMTSRVLNRFATVLVVPLNGYFSAIPLQTWSLSSASREVLPRFASQVNSA